MQILNIMRMSARFGILFGLSGLLSVAIVAFMVVRLSEFADGIATAPVNRPRSDGFRRVGAICVRFGAALLVCGGLLWWILRIAPFPKMG